MRPSERARRLLGRLRQPSYTGSNRCRRCTVVNAALAVVLATAVARRLSRAVGALVLSVAALLIYLRGYLLPGTPTLTRRYLPAGVLALFGKDRPLTLAALRSPAWSVAVADRDLPPAVAEQWRDRLAATDPDDLDAAAVVRTLGEDDVQAVPGGPAFVLPDLGLVRWESPAALAADVAAAAVLAARFPAWDDLDPAVRRRVLARLRRLVPVCPRCGAGPEVETGRTSSCCRETRMVVASRCPDCGATLVNDTIAAADDGSTTGARRPDPGASGF
jgi:hypothetical protein